jgi:hypothetical protein
MENIKVDKRELLEKVQENRDGHHQVFEDAMEVYREQMIKELDSMIADAKAGRKIRRTVSMPEPEDHTRDYDRVIKMLEMSVEDIIELDEVDFDRYVQDNWVWSHSFASNTTSYAAQNVRRTSQG